MAWTRKYAEKMRYRWARALQDIAGEVGKDAPLYKAMGSLAWGRYEGEPQPSERAPDVFRGVGYLMGYRDALLRAAEVAKWRGEDSLRRIHQRIDEMGRDDAGREG